MHKVVVGQRAVLSGSGGTYVPACTKYWESHPGLSQIGERYLSRARIRKESDGLVFVVRTNIQLRVIQPWKEVLESLLGEKIVSFEVCHDARPQDGTLAQKMLNQTREKEATSGALVTKSSGNVAFGEFSQGHSRQLAIQLTPNNPQKDRIEKEKARRIHAPNYIKSPSFEVAHHMLNRWASQLRQGNQVIWVYGAPGSGKTTLLRQLNHWVPLERKMECLDVMSFLHEWRRALDSNNTFAFIRKFRHETDILVLENIEELRNKVQTQQELLFTLNALAERGASFAVSSSVAPQTLKEDLDPQLYSRLLSGLVAELGEPDRAFKENLWRHMMTQHALNNVQVDLVVLEKLFQLNLSTAGKVNTVFINAIARLSVNHKLTLQDIYDFEGVHAPAVVPMTSTGMNPRQLIDRVSKLCGLSTAAVLGKSRRADVVLARKFVFLSLSRMLGMTNTSIAHYAEKDPSTVCHALKSIQNDLVNFRHVAKQWNWICTEMGQRETSLNMN
ncbi:MAG: DnaA/Hda family protein [Bdellovibrionota bacterium]